jgi:hypothetical protein
MPEDAFHQRLKRRRGSATAHACVGCGGPALEWAYQHGGDPLDYDGYSPMCRSCHRKLDYFHGTPVPSPLARLTDEQRRLGLAKAVVAAAVKRRVHETTCNRRRLASGTCRCGARRDQG